MKTHHTPKTHGRSHYKKLGLMALLSFGCMYGLMYSMVDRPGNVIPNLNQLYMALLMTSPMIIIEVLLMSSMYKNKILNTVILISSGIALVSCFLFIRYQSAVSDRQFLRSMIPHHAAALLMVKETQLSDPEIQKLANDIIVSQQREIDFMKAKLKEMKTK